MDWRPTRCKMFSTLEWLCLILNPSWIFKGRLTICLTVWRGFKEAYGSWNIIWFERLNLLSLSSFNLVISFPLNYILPEVGSWRRKIQRPKVVFPQPLSPIKPIVFPFWILKVTPFTAKTLLPLLFLRIFEIPWRKSNFFNKFLLTEKFTH